MAIDSGWENWKPQGIDNFLCDLAVSAVKTLPTMTPPETEGIALIMLGYQPFLRGYHWTRNATPQILIFANANNELVGLRGGVNVGRVFTNDDYNQSGL